MKSETKAAVFARRLEELTLVRVVRSGLVSMIPILTIGAFALILQTFPVAGYQRFLTTAVGGFFLDLFEFVYKATFGMLSVFMTFAISRAYMKQKADGEAVSGGAVLASLLTFFILAGAYLPEFGVDNMEPSPCLWRSSPGWALPWCGGSSPIRTAGRSSPPSPSWPTP